MNKFTKHFSFSKIVAYLFSFTYFIGVWQGWRLCEALVMNEASNAVSAYVSMCGLVAAPTSVVLAFIIKKAEVENKIKLPEYFKQESATQEVSDNIKTNKVTSFIEDNFDLK